MLRLLHLCVRILAWSLYRWCPMAAIALLYDTQQRPALRRLSRKLLTLTSCDSVLERQEYLLHAVIGARFADDIGEPFPATLDLALRYVKTHGSLEEILPRALAAEKLFGFKEPGVDGPSDWDRIQAAWLDDTTMPWKSIAALEICPSCTITHADRARRVELLCDSASLNPSFRYLEMCFAANHQERDPRLLENVLQHAVTHGLIRKAIELSYDFNHHIDDAVLLRALPDVLHESEDPRLAVIIGKYVGQPLTCETLKAAAEEYAQAGNDSAAGEALRLAALAAQPLVAQMQQ